MSIQIKYCRCGAGLVKVTDIKALPKEKLPFKYVDGDNHCYQYGDNLVIRNKGLLRKITKDTVYTTAEFEMLLGMVREAGEFLHNMSRKPKFQSHINTVKI